MALSAAATNINHRITEVGKDSQVQPVPDAHLGTTQGTECCGQIKVLWRFTVVVFGGVADTSPTWHLEEAWLLFYEEFLFLTRILECQKKKKVPLLHALAQCFVSVTIPGSNCTKRQQEAGAEIFLLGFGTSLLAPSLALLLE